MITKLSIISLPIGSTIYFRMGSNADGSPVRWRINGKVKLWKTRPDEFKVPIKYGLKQCDYITHLNADMFYLTEDEVYRCWAIQALSDLPHTYVRKPISWDDVTTHVNAEALQHRLKLIKTYTYDDLYGENLEAIPREDFLTTPDETVFILLFPDDSRMLINTEGYDYARYATQIF